MWNMVEDPLTNSRNVNITHHIGCSPWNVTTAFVRLYTLQILKNLIVEIWRQNNFLFVEMYLSYWVYHLIFFMIVNNLGEYFSWKDLKHHIVHGNRVWKNRFLWTLQRSRCHLTQITSRNITKSAPIMWQLC